MRVVTVSACIALILGASVTSRAQDAFPIELSGGYQLLHSGVGTNSVATNYPIGWQASFGVQLNSWLGVLTSTGADYKSGSSSFGSSAVSTVTTRATVYNVVAGPQFTKRVSTAVGLFTNIMFGVVHTSIIASSSTDIPSQDLQFGLSASGGSTRFAWQPGAGVDVRMNERWSARFGANYRVLQWSPSEGQVQLVTGVVFRP
jgi:opacity protein-like surface antigen